MSKRTLCWGQSPTDCLILSIEVLMSRPLIFAVPADGGNIPVKIELKNNWNFDWKLLRPEKMIFYLDILINLKNYCNLAFKTFKIRKKRIFYIDILINLKNNWNFKSETVEMLKNNFISWHSNKSEKKLKFLFGNC